jgi:hypothetical protein
MLLLMGNERQKGWREYETYEDAARRLLAELDERSKKRKTLAAGEAGGGTNCSSKGVCPCASLEKSGLANRTNGPHAIDASPQFSQPREDGCDPVASKGFSGNGLDADGVVCVGSGEPDEVTMRPSAPSADSNRHVFTTGLEGHRAVRWGKS